MREFPSSFEILKLFAKNPEKTFRLRELVLELGLRSSQARELKRALGGLSRDRKIVYLKKGHYMLDARLKAGATSPDAGVKAGPTSIATGRLIGHRDGYGFVVPDVPVEGTDLDIFVPAAGMARAMHGDRVEVRILRSGVRGRMEGRIGRVLNRAQKTVVGQFHSSPRQNYVVPFDQRLPYEIVIPPGQEWPRAGLGSPKRHRQFGGESEGRETPRHESSTPVGTPALQVGGSARDLEGMIVDVELTGFPGPGQSSQPASAGQPRGRVIEILGRREDFGVDVEMVIRKFHLPHRFPAEVLLEASAAPQFISEGGREGRRDFRDLPIVTIDGETAKDFDDAVYVERLPGGNYLLQVHIADVAHYVRPGTALDREARLRGTSVYFPDRAVPMLPLELSNGICSLNPRVERLTMSALIEIDPEGRMVGYKLLPGIIRSVERMTYTAVRDILSGEATAWQRYAPRVADFMLMEELAKILTRRREARGSIDFDLPEPEIEFDEHGRMVGVTRSERNVAHRIIEEFMLAANEVVADFLERRGVPTLYRIHEKPDAKKVIEFEEIAATFGHSLGIELPAARRMRVRSRDERERYPRFEELLDSGDLKITSHHYQRLTKRLEGKPEERILSYLILRSLKQARYSEENVGHFALAAPTYTHFTSPIRRYPDLIVHRILKAVLAKEGPDLVGGAVPRLPARAGTRDVRSKGGAHVSREELHTLGIETSEAERRAADAERELMEWKKVSFMAGRLGDEFDALIISLIKHGFFVELTDLFVEGFVPLASLPAAAGLPAQAGLGNGYVYRQNLRAIVSRHSDKAYRLGDRVRVRLDRIDREANRLEFSVVD